MPWGGEGAPSDTVRAMPGGRSPTPTMAMTPPPKDPLLGAQVGSYKILRLLGTGGMGSVYLGEHSGIGSKVAIKFLHEHLSSSADLVQRFYAEARSVNTIGHANIVSIFDMNVLPPNRYYLVMELLEGASLESKVNNPDFPIEKWVGTLTQVCDALDQAHAHGIVHRDLKPENVMLVKRGREENFVKVLDFGIAKLQSSVSDRRTATGVIIGTPDYMAPEQASGDPIDGRTDQYSLGIIAYELATGRTPFAGLPITAMLVAHLSQEPRAPHSVNPAVPAGVSAAIMKALAKRPESRFATCGDFGRALEQALQLHQAQAAQGAVLVGPPIEHLPPRATPTPADAVLSRMTPAGTDRSGQFPAVGATAQSSSQLPPVRTPAPSAQSGRFPPVGGPSATAQSSSQLPPVRAPTSASAQSSSQLPAVSGTAGSGRFPATDVSPSVIAAQAPPRHVVSVEVEVKPEQGPSQKLQMQDVSRAGCFVVSQGPLPRIFSKVTLTLPGVGLVQGDVVRHVSAEQAQAWNMPQGFGVQFTSVKADQRDALEALTKGTPLVPVSPQAQPTQADDFVAEKTLAEFRRRVNGDHYVVLGLHQDTDVPTVRARGRELSRQLLELRNRPLSPAQLKQVDASMERVQQAVDVLGVPTRRVEFDGMRTNWRGVAMCLSAGLRVPELEAVRARYLANTPGAETKARLMMISANGHEAGGQYAEALKHCEQALGIDPLNLDLHHKRNALLKRLPK